MKRILTLSMGVLALALCLPTHAQNTVVTYQGRVTDNGTNFNGTGQFKFAIVTSTNANHAATAIAPVQSGSVLRIFVVDGGNGYLTPPTVTISGGGGSGATATASVSGGAVASIQLDTAGSNYVSQPTVIVSLPPESLTYMTYWSNDGTSTAGSEPAANLAVPVANGLFTVGLGDTSLPNMTQLNAGLFQQPDLQLRLWFNNGMHGFGVLSPTQPLTAAPYAAFAQAATSLAAASNQPVNLSINGMSVLRLSLATEPIFGLTANSVGGSPANVISNGFAGGFIGGGGSDLHPNRVGGDYASVLGGVDNIASGFASTAMGRLATASGTSSTAMGVATTASGLASTAMGFFTTASGDYSTAIGYGCSATGYWSTAMGNRAKAVHDGSFVWADAQGLDFTSTDFYQFCIRAAGGVQLNTDTSVFFGNQTRQMLNLFGTDYGIGVQGATEYFRSASEFNWFKGGVHNDTAGNAGAGGTRTMNLDGAGNLRTLTGVISSLSDRNAKTNFEPVDARDVLERVASLPITRWNFKSAPAAQRHLGPMAQDFYAAFNIGLEDTGICTVDADGVALAAIQGLNEKVEVRSQKSEDRMQKLESENAELKVANQALEQRLERLESMLSGNQGNHHQPK